MNIYYELLGVDVWIHPSGQAALIGVCGVVDRSERAQFAASTHTGATWSHSRSDTADEILLLTLRGKGILSAVELCFTASPSPNLLDGLRFTNESARFMVLFTDLAVMKKSMTRFAAAPGSKVLADITAKALYGGHFRVEPGTLGHFTG